MKVKRNTLLLLACLVWSAAGFNILRIGLSAYPAYRALVNYLLSAVVFAVFQKFIFGKLVKKHTARISAYEEERHFFLKFFDLKSFAIMAVMMSGGIALRSSGLAPERFIAFFYTGLGASLLLAGLLFGCNFGKAAKAAAKSNESFKKRGKLTMQAIVETLFDAVYLISVITIGVLMIRGSKGNAQFKLFGLMAVVLGAGDSFHLVPRALALCTTGLENYTVPLGLGKWITSVTMTVFYVLLYYVWRKRYEIKGKAGLTAAVYGLAAARVILCMMPQNQWLSAASPLSWGIYRNIPFAILGLLIIVLFYRSAKERSDSAFRWMWLTIVMSFGFYIPVVLWADTIPMIGMLMIPKTCAYVWTVLIGYRAMKQECK